MDKALILWVVMSLPCFGQGILHPILQTQPPSGPPPTFVAQATNFTGGGTLAFSATLGDRLVVITFANDTTTGHTCSDNATGGTNTYVNDIANILGAGGAVIIGNAFHVASLKTTQSITITCTGTSAMIMAVEYSGGTGALDTASAGGTGGKAYGTATSNASGNMSPTAFTPSTAATILVDSFGSITSSTATASQTDTNYTTDGTCLTGATCFVGGLGHRAVSSSASYTDGWTATGNAGWIAFNEAFK